MLPPFDQPRVLDAGCGPAMSTLERVQLGGEQVIGTDIHRPSVCDPVGQDHRRWAFGLPSPCQVLNAGPEFRERRFLHLTSLCPAHPVRIPCIAVDRPCLRIDVEPLLLLAVAEVHGPDRPRARLVR